MNGSSSSNPAGTPATANAGGIDGSCRVLLVPLLGSFVWLVLASVLALIASVKLHSPTFLADCSWLAYGRLRSAANAAFIYGFASQAGLVVGIWMLCRLGRTALAGGLPAGIGALFWNLGVTMGVVGVLGGHSTGFDWLEFPNAGSVLLTASYLVLATVALLTFRNRQPGALYPSQWFLLGALLWFPWLYTTARLLLVWFPVRGAMQLAVNIWYGNGLFTLWLGGIGLALLHYFIPKLAGAPLHSRTLAVLSFWTLALFGGWAGAYVGLPLPAWMVGVGSAAAVLLLIPTVATVANLWLTLGQGKSSGTPELRLLKVSLLCFAFVMVFRAFAVLVPQLRLTLFAEGTEQLALYGFVGLGLMAAVQHIVPKLTGVPDDGKGRLGGTLVMVGILIFAAAYLAGGVLQQKGLVDASVPYATIMNKSKMFIRLSTLGLLLVALGNVAMLVRVTSQLRASCRLCCARCGTGAGTAPELKPAGAAR